MRLSPVRGDFPIFTQFGSGFCAAGPYDIVRAQCYVVLGGTLSESPTATLTLRNSLNTSSGDHI